MKRIVIVCIVMCILFASGCGESTSPGPATQGTTGTTTTTAVAAATPTQEQEQIPEPDPNVRYEISYYAHYCGELEDDSYVEKLIQDALNIEIKVRNVNHADGAQVNLMLASGDMPDCGWFIKSSEEMWNQELVRTVPRNMVEKYVPSLTDIYNEYPILYAALTKDDDTTFDFLPGYSRSHSDIFMQCDFYRYDWIQALGIDLGVNVEKLTDNLYIADNGLTPDKHREVMEGFVNADPDGNGKNDTIGMTGNNLAAPTFMSGFGLLAGINNVDGHAEGVYVTPQYKEMLGYLAGLYQSGMMDQEYLTQSSAEFWEKVSNGVAGHFVSTSNQLNTWAMNRPPLMLFERNPDSVLLMTPGWQSPTGKSIQQKTTSPRNYGFFINKDVTDDKKLAKILQFLEYSCFGETVLSHWNGEEGVDWVMEGNEVMKLNPLTGGVKGAQSFCVSIQTGLPWEALNLEPLFRTGVAYYLDSAGGLWNNNYWQYAYKEDINNETEAAKIWTDVGGDISNAVAAYRMDVILGNKDVNSTWDAYIEELNSLGYREYISEFDKLPPLEDIMREYNEMVSSS